jgi:hypothetical protein
MNMPGAQPDGLHPYEYSDRDRDHPDKLQDALIFYDAEIYK